MKFIKLDDEFWKTLETLYKNEDGDLKGFEFERPSLEKIFEALDKELGKDYDFKLPIGVGGSGVIMKLFEKKFPREVALKIPRPKKETSDLIESVKLESLFLRELSHKNIIQLYKLDEVEVVLGHRVDPIKYPFFIMEYIENAENIKNYVQNQLDDIKNYASGKDLSKSEIKKKHSRINKLIKEVADFFYAISKTINFLHSKNIIHFDIKPSNILIKDGKPIITDLGFAKKYNPFDINKKVIGFTYLFAHPNLRHRVHIYMSNRDRVRLEMAPDEYKYKYDIYAFGRTLSVILKIIDEYFTDHSSYNYTFSYLHLTACRMLDGKNTSDSDIEKINKVIEKEIMEKKLDLYKYDRLFSEEWQHLKSTHLETIKYKSFDEIILDFSKLKKPEKLLEEVPELSPFFPSKIRVVKGSPAAFSDRVSQILGHKSFRRLKSVQQLGMINTIYPTANHNRFEHSLGVFRNCCLYINSLYNDPYNPLFKQLITNRDIESLLVASLFHDIGHFPLAHLMEDFGIDDLNHEEFTKIILDTESVSNLITKNWNTDINYIKELIDPHDLSNDLKTQMLHSILSGPVDIDKLDYLQRDSDACKLNYGDIVDEDRLLKNLTVIITDKDDLEDKLFIGTYQKGQTAAESLAFTRYLLYQSVYNHHTSRGIKVMLMEAIRPLLSQQTTVSDTKTPKDIKPKDLDYKDLELKKQFTEETGKRSIYKGIPTKEYSDWLKSKGIIQTSIIEHLDFVKELEFRLKDEDETKQIRNEHDLLDFIDKKAKNKTTSEFIRLLEERNYYKRIFTVHAEKPFEEGTKSLLDDFRNNFKKPGFQEELQTQIADKFLITVKDPNIIGSSTSLNKKRIEIVSNLLAKPKMILCDCPIIRSGIESSLKVMPEPKRLQKNYISRIKHSFDTSQIYSRVYHVLMDIASKGRIYCHPDVRDTLNEALKPEDIQKCLENVIKKFINK